MAAVNVLVVEDDAGMRSLLHQMLEKEGHAVTEAASAEDALRAIGTGHVDVVLLDLVLGYRKSGLDVLHTLREHVDTARLPVMILTGAAITEAEEEQIRREAAYVFYKPPNAPELLSYIARLGRQRAQRTSLNQ